MTRPTTDQGQRVQEPAAVSGDAAAIGEQDPRKLKDNMAQAAHGSDEQLKQREDKAEEDASAVQPDHRQNDAGQ